MKKKSLFPCLTSAKCHLELKQNLCKIKKNTTFTDKEKEIETWESKEKMEEEEKLWYYVNGKKIKLILQPEGTYRDKGRAIAVIKRILIPQIYTLNSTGLHAINVGVIISQSSLMG